MTSVVGMELQPLQHDFDKRQEPRVGRTRASQPRGKHIGVLGPAHGEHFSPVPDMRAEPGGPARDPRAVEWAVPRLLRAEATEMGT